jgi:hypothetical protein
MAHDPNKFWDLAEVFGPHATNLTYTDFEGLAEITEDDKSWITFYSRTYDLNDMQSDILLHLVFEEKNEYGRLPDSGQMHAYANAIQQLTTTREWMKSEINWKEVP